MRLILLLSFIFIVLVSGCISEVSPEEIAKGSKEVNAFLEEHPRATIISSLVPDLNIQQECENPQLAVKEYWKVSIKDPDTNTTALIFIDSDSKKTVCVIKTGGISREPVKVTDNSKNNEIPTGKVIASPETKEVKKDPCAGITCTDSYKTCPDGDGAKCSNTCSSGVCSSCAPDCSGHVACTESWTCTEWPKCNYEGKQKRYCSDSNFCGTTKGKPLEEQNCECTPDWQCLEWGSCTLGKQYRACSDNNYCLSQKNKPVESQSCTCTPDWKCAEWSACSTGYQTRTCNIANDCISTEGMPPIVQQCSNSGGGNAGSNCEKRLLQEEDLSSYADCRDFCVFSWMDKTVDGYTIKSTDISYEFNLIATDFGHCKCSANICK